jgi:hypothetical protein
MQRSRANWIGGMIVTGGATSMRKIIISYRRDDARSGAGALGPELRRHFGDKKVFRRLRGTCFKGSG